MQAPSFQKIFFTIGLAGLSLSLTACGNEPPAPIDTGEVVVEEPAFTGTFEQLMADGEDVQCTFTYADAVEGTTVSGKIYAEASGRMRGEFTMQNEDTGPMSSNMINDGEFIYTWGLPTPQDGIKMQVTAADQNEPEQAPGGWNENQPMEYDCDSWNVDASLFVPPADVEFRDLSAQMDALKQQAEKMHNDQCGACDQIPDPEAKAQCRAALGC